MSDASERWYVVAQESGECLIVTTVEPATGNVEQGASTEQSSCPYWGPFDSKDEAIAKRVGLIRAGQCKPR